MYTRIIFTGLAGLFCLYTRSPFTVVAGLFYVYRRSLLTLVHTAEWQRDTERQIHENERARLDYLSEVIYI